MISFPTDKLRKKTLFWTSKEIVFLFNCSNSEKNSWNILVKTSGQFINSFKFFLLIILFYFRSLYRPGCIKWTGFHFIYWPTHVHLTLFVQHNLQTFSGWPKVLVPLWPGFWNRKRNCWNKRKQSVYYDRNYKRFVRSTSNLWSNSRQKFANLRWSYNNVKFVVKWGCHQFWSDIRIVF